MNEPLPAPRDVRMRGFRDRADVDAVVDLIATRITPPVEEEVTLEACAGRVLARDVAAPADLPGFRRAAMDGFALRGRETFGASTDNPLPFRCIGEARPGLPHPGEIQPGEAVRIMTGAPVPPGADAIAPAETARQSGTDLLINEAVPPGRHIGERGEDVPAGEVVLRAGRVLRPQDAALLAGLGVTPVPVAVRPRVDLLLTGDELLPPGSQPAQADASGRVPAGPVVVDSNSVMLRALVERDGGTLLSCVRVADTADAVRQALAMARAEIILISGGSSVGAEDHAPQVLTEVGTLLVHGVGMRPASPFGFGERQGALVFLLPGNPVSCLCAYDLFAGPAIRRAGGRPSALPYRQRRVPLAGKIASALGRLDYVRVVFEGDAVRPLSVSGAGVLSTTVRADGFVLVPAGREGHAPGESVTVHLYD